MSLNRVPDFQQQIVDDCVLPMFGKTTKIETPHSTPESKREQLM
jgi:hypothetical protein